MTEYYGQQDWRTLLMPNLKAGQYVRPYATAFLTVSMQHQKNLFLQQHTRNDVFTWNWMEIVNLVPLDYRFLLDHGLAC